MYRDQNGGSLSNGVLPPSSKRGLVFTKYCALLAGADGIDALAVDMSRRHYGEYHPVTDVAKAAVAAANMDADGWAGKIAENDSYSEFFGIVDETTVVGRIGARRAPLGTKLSAVATATQASWRGQGKPAPLTSGVFSASNELPPLSVDALAVISKELTKMGAANSDVWIRDELLRAVVQRVDTDFLDPTNSGVTDEKPASILNGVTPITATSSIDDDLDSLLVDFDGDLTKSVWVARPEVYSKLNGWQSQRVGLRGGTLLEAPALATRYAPNNALILIDADGIAVGDESAKVTVSENASLEMLDGSLLQDGTDGTGAATVSLWQNGLTGIMISRQINWKRIRSAVSYISGIGW